MRCALGDLAIVVHSSIPCNVGRIVRVTRPSTRFPNAWTCESQGTYLAGYRSELGDVIYALHVVFNDTQLRPIRGLDEVIKELSHEV